MTFSHSPVGDRRCIGTGGYSSILEFKSMKLNLILLPMQLLCVIRKILVVHISAERTQNDNLQHSRFTR